MAISAATTPVKVNANPQRKKARILLNQSPSVPTQVRWYVSNASLYAEIGRISSPAHTFCRSSGAICLIVKYSPGIARLKSSIKISATSLAMSLISRFSVSRPNAVATSIKRRVPTIG